MHNQSKGEQEKIKLEHEAAKLFMRAYEKNTGHEIRHIWHNKPRKPDTSCMLGGEHLDMEIAHLYGSEVEAMKLLGKELPEKSRLDLHLLVHSTDTNERLVLALNLILENKSKKHYRSSRVWLIIRNANPEWDAQIIKNMVSRITLPSSHSFDQIWIVGDMQGESGIVCLYQSSARE
mgnify:CR=1 FL=1